MKHLSGCIGRLKRNYSLLRTAKCLADDHGITSVAVPEQPFGYRCGRFAFIGKYPDQWSAFDQQAIELLPASPGQGSIAHALIGHAETMRKHLQRGKRRDKTDLCCGNMLLQCRPETVKQRITRGEHNDFFPDFTELVHHILHGGSYGDPSIVPRKQMLYDSPVTHPPGKHPA